MAGQPSWLTRLWARARRAWYSRSVRAEDAVFADLQRLCRSPGYIYALAAICARNDWIAATGQLQPGDFSGQYAPEHFTRTELSPLLGILVQGLIDYTCPRPSVLNHYVLETQSLLKQFHSAVIRGSITPMLDRPRPSVRTPLPTSHHFVKRCSTRGILLITFSIWISHGAATHKTTSGSSKP